MFSCCSKSSYNIGQENDNLPPVKSKKPISNQPQTRSPQIPAVIITKEETSSAIEIPDDLDIKSVCSSVHSDTASLDIPVVDVNTKAVNVPRRSSEISCDENKNECSVEHKDLNATRNEGQTHEAVLETPEEECKNGDDVPSSIMGQNKNDSLSVKDEVESLEMHLQENSEELDEIADLDLKEAIPRRGGIRSQTVEFQPEIPIYKKTEDEESAIKTALKANEFLWHVLKDEHIQTIIEAMHPKEVEPKDVLTRQGDDGDRMFVSSSGKYQIIVDKKHIDSFHNQRIFGELAILYNTPRLATIIAVTKGKVWILERNTYKQIVRKSAIAEEEERLQFLRNVPEVNKASDRKLQKIANLFTCEFYKTNTTIIKQGDKGDKFYIVKSGTTTVSIEGQGNVGTLGRGQFFGERALLQEDFRQATVKAVSPGVECLVLSRKDFNKYLGDLPSFIEKEEPTIKKDVIVNEYEHIEFEHLLYVGMIGAGGFGRVSLVQCKEKPDLVFALKFMKKQNIIKNKQKKQAYNERNIQIACKSAFIVRLYKTFQDKKYLYYLMECCLGGDLWGLLVKQKKRYFEEDSARFIAACVLEALSYLHQRNYAYLDLKPENILVASNGYVKLADFGNAVHLPGNVKCFNFAGTPEYVAPEIILERGHDRAADYWAFGIFIYELLVGRTPFKSNDPMHMKTYTAILKGIEGIPFSSKVHRSAEDIIKKLCRANKTKRLGCRRNGIEDIREHKWFGGFKWKKLQSGELISPFVPTLKGNLDVSNFEKVEKDLSVPDDCEMWDDFC